MNDKPTSPPKPTPWLSVIVPTYNGEAYLAGALSSIADEGDPDLECIVIDDGSTDSTLEIVQRFADRISVSVRKGERTGNWAANSNLALSLSTGEYACFLHQDDFWLAGRLATVKELVRRYPEADLLLGPSVFVDRRGRSVGRWRCPLPGTPGLLSAGLLASRLLVQNFIAIAAPVFKRKTALDLGGLDESLWYTADWDFWLKFAGRTAVYHPRALAAFRVHDHSQTVQGSLDLAGFQAQMETVLERHLARLPATDEQLARIERNARFSVRVNTALAARLHGGKIGAVPLLAEFLKLGPLGCRQHLRDSRILERVAARIRAGIRSS